MIAVLLNETYRALPDLLPDRLWYQALNLLHEALVRKITLRGSLGDTGVESLRYGFRRDSLLKIVSELAKQLVVKRNRPVLAQELSDVRNKASIVSLGYLVQVLNL